LGRVEYGVAHALESRYVAFSIYVVIALIGLGAILVGEQFTGPSVSWHKRRLLVPTLLLGAICLSLEILCATASITVLRSRAAFARLGQAAVLFCQVMDTADPMKRGNHPVANLVRQRANTLDQHHLLRPPLVRTPIVSKLQFAGVDKNAVAGLLDQLVTSPESGLVTARGWAALLRQKRSADCVILAYEREDRELIAFAMSNTIELRPDVAQQHRHPEWAWAGWRAVFRSDAVPKGATISAWAVDTKQARLYRLAANAEKLQR
jgi:hypothetical protein